MQFKQQHRFRTCKRRITLPFDFIAFYNKKLFAIEYQGRQHFEAVKFSPNMTDDEAERNFEIVKETDQIKRDWCQSKGLPLLEIAHYENIEKCLENFLNRTLNIAT